MARSEMFGMAQNISFTRCLPGEIMLEYAGCGSSLKNEGPRTFHETGVGIP